MPESWILSGGTLFTPRGKWMRGDLLIEGECLRQITPPGKISRRRQGRVDARGCFVLPGLIDLHVNGVGSCDLANNPDGWIHLSREMARRGVTSFLPALISAPLPRLLKQVAAAAGRFSPRLPGARALGLHLEGPFLNPQRRGVHPRGGIARYSRAKLLKLLEAGAGKLRMMTLAPEKVNVAEAAALLRRKGILPALGHTDADFAAAEEAIRRGFRFATHLFNAMRPFHHRDPGAVGAALQSGGITAGLIPDGAHVSPAAIEIALRAKGPHGVAFTSDELVGAENGARFAGRRLKRGNGVWLAQEDGAIAGGARCLLEGLRGSCAAAKRDWREWIALVTINPARAIGIAHRTGSLEPGKRADLVVVSKNLQAQMTVVSGKIVYQR